MSCRADRLDGQGGGVLILVSRVFQVSGVVNSLGHRREVSCVGVALSTAQGQVAVLCVYAPPGPVIDGDEWSSYLEGIVVPYNMIFYCGDFNVHHISWGCSRNIDLIFCPLSLSRLARVDVVSDPFGSDHLPVVLALVGGLCCS